jgi:hypothetical protein
VAWALVQSVASGANSGVNSDTTAYGSNVTSGNLLICTGAVWDWPPTGLTVQDTVGTNYTIAFGSEIVGSGQTTWIAFGLAPSSGANTVTVNPSQAVNDFSYTIAEFSGAPAGNVADVNGGSTTGALGVTATDSLTTVAVNALIIGVMSQSGVDTTLTKGADYTDLGETETNDGNACHHAVYRVVTAPGVYTVDWTLGAARDWGAQTYSFRPAATAMLTGTATASITETDIVNGGKTIILTLTNDTWVPD